jgi:hypothetical protein
MNLPFGEQATVFEPKITAYLLSLTHPDGRSKAHFFLRYGFSAARWWVLADALVHHGSTHEVVKQETTPFGTKYVVEGILLTPDGRTPFIRTVWLIATDTSTPHLITAYPVTP